MVIDIALIGWVFVSKISKTVGHNLIWSHKVECRNKETFVSSKNISGCTDQKLILIYPENKTKVVTLTTVASYQLGRRGYKWGKFKWSIFGASLKFITSLFDRGRSVRETEDVHTQSN